MNSYLDKLKEIKPIVEVTDFSFYYFITIIFISFIIIAFVLYKYFTKVKKTKKLTQKQIALKRLKNLNFKDVKNIVYSFTVDGFLFINDKNRDKFKTLEEKLEQYKYKKDIQNLPNKLKNEIKQFIKGLK
jgi:hypothetical protein